MPTAHVTPESGDLLQDIADCLSKSRKVVVVTGAGISTNSGIPDFRSENGLYSLIQAQFEAAAKEDHDELSEPDPDASSASSFSDECRPTKRRRIQSEENEENEIHVATDSTTECAKAAAPGLISLQPGCTQPAPDSSRSQGSQTESRCDISDQSMSDAQDSSQEAEAITVFCADSTVPNSPYSPVCDDASGPSADTTLSSIHVSQEDHAPDTTSTPPRILAQNTKSLRHLQVPFCSSPLSSPPPILFDPYEESPTDTASTSSSSSSETDETPPSSDPFASQSSIGSRSSLPNLKGRDLFDVSIWADPMKTSVFYTFATTLRQKVRAVRPTTSHHFISHLRDRGKLVRCYTQNIDEIEEKVGLSTSLVLGPGHRGRFSTRSASRSSIGSDTKDPQTGGASKPSSVRDTRDPGVECVFLHGSLHALRCFLCGEVCNWDEANRETETLSGRQPSCPRCEGATAARQERGKRALGVGKLRPDIVLYGEEHPNAHLISPIVQHDISLAPDLMLILGTSLRVHGLKVLVKEFAKAIHRRGGKVVFVNFTKPPESVWSDIIDYWIQWDCDAWVQDLKERQPALWLPPEQCASLVAKPKSRPKAKTKPRRATEGVVQPTHTTPIKEVIVKRELSDIVKPEARRPVAIRDNKANGAFLVSKIMEDLAKAVEPQAPPRPLDSTTRTTSRRKKPRQSAPALLESRRISVAEEAIIVKTTEQPGDSVAHSPGTTQFSAPLAYTVAADQQTVSLPSEPRMSSPAETGSILDAVKSNPRKRKRKIIDGIEVLLPKQGRIHAKGNPKTQVPEPPQALEQVVVNKPDPPSTPALSSGSSDTTQPWQRTDALIANLSRQATPVPGFDQNLAIMSLPAPRPLPSRPGAPSSKGSSLCIPALAVSHSRPSVPKPRLAPLEPPTTNTGPLTVISANLRYHERSRMGDPFFLTDPMVARLQRPPASKGDHRPQEWNPTAQLINESERATEAAMTLSLLRMTTAQV
ncbi:uncharacterized protein E0L32_010304 [Thyridium curvatum]|uniref:Deacetylase sirtuin-type domain-containing protein n=1 Tax=Thyridium curvatum TaxID=1093900 RepID=A0A507AKJ6_9PEZI|nr:uncharacterized protein E0L32_010304 [Thyridium curvatum]TPX07973.1 hypothetical protein E0L32_010304 [Thyridium curvatum]